MFFRLMCWLGHCFRCEPIHDDPEGIGGRCIDCGKIHGWVTRAELRAYADRICSPSPQAESYPVNASRRGLG